MRKLTRGHRSIKPTRVQLRRPRFEHLENRNLLAGVLSDLLSFDAATDTLNDNSRTQYFDINGNDLIDEGDQVVGVFQIDTVNAVGDPFPGSIFAAYAGEIASSRVASGLTIFEVEPIAASDPNSLRSRLDASVHPYSVSDPRWNDTMFVMTENPDMGAPAGGGAPARDPFNSSLDSIAAYDIGLGGDPVQIITDVLTAGNGYSDVLTFGISDSDDFFDLVINPNAPATTVSGLRADDSGTTVFLERGGFTILADDLGLNVDYLDVQTQKFGSTVVSDHDINLQPDGLIQTSRPTVPLWDFEDDTNFRFNPVPGPELASLGDFVWVDANADGQQDANELGIDGVTVNLIDPVSGNVIGTTITGDDPNTAGTQTGYYEFIDLAPGDYIIEFVLPNGYEFTQQDVGSDLTDSDADTTTGQTGTITLDPGENDPTNDAGLVELASLGDFVWVDANADGQQDANELGIDGVTVNLIDPVSGNVIGTTITGDDPNTAGTQTGYYEFIDLTPGDYIVEFVLPNGYEFTQQDIGSDLTDSDADATTGRTGTITLDPGENDPTNDAGLVELVPGIDIEKFTNGVNADDAVDAPGILPGGTVTWTYKVTNTGGTSFTTTQIVIVDDAGTPADTGDDFGTASGDIVFDAGLSTGLHDGDALLEPGEMWVYVATGIAEDLSTAGPSTTFHLTGSSSTDGTDGNVRTFTSGGISVNASAFSRTTSGTWQDAYLGSFSSGLGVTDSGEGNGGNGTHRVDNVGRYNYVLFEFSEAVVVDRAFLDSVVNDSDASIWIGTVADAFTNHVTLSDAVLSGLDLNETNNTGSGSSRWVDVNSGKVAGNVLVIAASVEDPTPEDRFKIRKLDVQAAQPGIYRNVGVVTTGPNGPTDEDPSHYVNPVVDPGIDIEKFTNGVNADTPGEAPAIDVGATVMWSYEVTNTGNTAFSTADVVIVDDAGTPGNTSDDFSTTSGDIVFDAGLSSGLHDGDASLEPGEAWVYIATGTAEDLSTTGASTTFHLTGNSSTDGSNGNIRTFTSGGVSVNASAFSSNGSSDFQTAFLGAFSSGLGVTDNTEGNGGNGTHRVDNIHRINYVLFEFSETVVVDQTFLDSVVNDSDITVWIGTKSDPFNNHLTLSDSLLSSLDLKEDNWTGSSSSRWANVNSGEATGNVLVIAASTADATPEDRFKIRKLKVQKTEPGVYGNIGVVTTGPSGPTDSDPSHYKNSDGDLGIDIEKLTNNVDADDPQGSDVPEITPGENVTWTYLVTNTGDIDIAFADVVVVDDNGTPGETADDFTPTFDNGSDVNSDGVLSPGEEWTYTHSEAAALLHVVIDFDDLATGTEVHEQYQNLGVTISTNSPSNHPAMIFDSENPTGGDTDLATPGYGPNNDNALEKILIISEDGDGSDPDDNGSGGTLIFDFDEPVRVNDIDILDIDAGETGGTVKTFNAGGGLIATYSIADVGDNGFQSIAMGDLGVSRMEVKFVSSGAVTELNFDRTYANVATATVGAVQASDPSHYRNPPAVSDPDEAYKRFFVVDTYVDKTFEYDSDGTPLENSHLANSNGTPRGITMTVDGSKNWVVDKYNGVFAYDDSGNLLGQWDAGGLDRPEGIATNEEDIWIVDRSSDRVFFYDDGATNHANSIDSQSPTSSFSLASGNKNPRGMTMAGDTIWVVNDGKYEDKVFVYSTSGVLQGSWKLSHNVKPRGITINPGDVRDIWIVDAKYDKVHEYQDGASFTSGTRIPELKWTLVSGNRKPEGLADPPPPVAGVGGRASSPFATLGLSTGFDNFLTLREESSAVEVDDLVSPAEGQLTARTIDDVFLELSPELEAASTEQHVEDTDEIIDAASSDNFFTELEELDAVWR